MANILRQGKTPYWGTWDSEGQKFNSLKNGVIIDSFNTNIEIKDYEQTDENGAVCGYLIYDQTVGFDMSGTILNTNNCLEIRVGDAKAMSCTNELKLLPFLLYEGQHIGFNQEINVPNIAIIKSASFNTSAGGAATFSLSGTAYSFN